MAEAGSGKENCWLGGGWGAYLYVTLFVVPSLNFIVLICDMELMGHLPGGIPGRVK